MYDRVRKKYVGISRRRIMTFLKNQESWQLRKADKIPRVTRPIVVKEPNVHVQADLIDMHQWARYNRGVNFILNAVDLYSKRAWSMNLPNKSAGVVANAFETLYQQGMSAKVIQTDNGKEFKNNLVSEVMKRLGIKQIYSKSYSPSTQGAVERFNQTFKNMVKQWMVQSGRKDYTAVTHLLLMNYNSSRHRTTGKAPDRVPVDDPDVTHRIQKAARKHMSSNAPAFKRGDTVRVRTRSLPEWRVKGKTFEKPFFRWSRQVYVVKGVSSPDVEWQLPRYLLNNGITYSGFELQPVNLNTMVPVAKRIGRVVRNVYEGLELSDDPDDQPVESTRMYARGRDER